MPPRHFTATDVPGLQSTAVAQPPNPPPAPDPYSAGVAEGRLRELEAVVAWLLRAPDAKAWRQEPMEATAAALLRGEHLSTPAPDPTADRAQVRALGAR